MIELAVKVSNEFQRYRQVFDIDPAFEKLSMDLDDPNIKIHVDEALANFKGEAQNIEVTTKMQYR